MNRTLDHLRNTRKGKIYVWLRDADTIRRFYADAQAQGYRFGQIKPSGSPPDDIIALGRNKQLSHVGFVGRLAFQCNGGNCPKGTFHRIDYARYVSGEKKYDYRPPRSR